MNCFKTLICLTLITAVSANGMADEKKKKKRQARGPKVTQRYVAKMELSDDQKVKVAEIDKKFAAKAKELNEKRAAILTDEQRKTQRDMLKVAKEAKKKPQEARKAVDEALKLTDDQKKKMVDLKKTQQAFAKEVLTALKAVLTKEQQEKLPKQRTRKGKGDAAKKGKGKKKKDDK